MGLTAHLTFQKTHIMEDLKQIQENLFFPLSTAHCLAEEFVRRKGSFDDFVAWQAPFKGGVKSIIEYSRQARAWKTEDVSRIPLEDLEAALRAYSVLSSFKDCSLILSFAPINKCTIDVPGVQTVEVDGKILAFRIGVVDLDYKHPTRIFHYFERERKIDELVEGVDTSCRWELH
mmetsp:Transcript_33105/g.85200  ORF Transcript_33105/g.85200 Transcript_33105/m.85200 type:complete len:175 (+) Transcript_33105:847-1371(+)